MKDYIKLLRPKHWIKNLFLFLPSFFAGSVFEGDKMLHLIEGFFAFSLVASSIYIFNDYRDIENDKKHPVKCKRPLASGKVKKTTAIVICILLFLTGVFIAAMAEKSYKFLFILSVYFAINLAYSVGVKNVAILDILILSSGFVLRVKGGAAISEEFTSHWIIIMTFLLALFMAIAKRRDDVLLKLSTGKEMRKSMSGYSLDFLNTMTGLLGAIIIVDYIMYSVDAVTIARLGTGRLYYTSLFVIAGIMRYLQLVFVNQQTGSPTDILYKDRFIQVTVLLWIVSFYFIIYIKDIVFFAKV